MDKEEYYKRIEKINNRFKTDRVSADEEYQLVCQRNYLSTKYIEHLEQQCKKQKEVINAVNKKINNFIGCCKAEKLESGSDYIHHRYWDMFERFNKQIKDILKEVL